MMGRVINFGRDKTIVAGKTLYSLLRELEPVLISETMNLTVPTTKYDGTIFNYKVSEFESPSVARNNCSAVSNAIVDKFDFTERIDGIAVEVAGIETPAGNHYGILLTLTHENGLAESAVIDFSARQFSPLISFPLIMNSWAWQEWVEANIGRMGTWSNEDAWGYDDY